MLRVNSLLSRRWSSKQNNYQNNGQKSGRKIEGNPLYLDANAEIDERVEDLVAGAMNISRPVVAKYWQDFISSGLQQGSRTRLKHLPCQSICFLSI